MTDNPHPEISLHTLANSYREKVYDYDRIYNSTLALLDAKASVFRKDERGRSCYHLAAANGVYPMIRALLDKGIRMNMTDREGRTVLHAASENAGDALSSADRAEKREREWRQQVEEDPKESYLKTWKSAAADLERQQQIAENYFLIVKALVEAGVDTESKDNSGRTALDYAIEGNAKKIAAYLKVKGTGGEAEGINPQTGGMNLHQACEKGDQEAIRALIESGEKLNEVSDTPPHRGKTPLAVAMTDLNPELIDTLLEAGADPNLTTGERGQMAFLSLLNDSRVTSATYSKKTIPRVIQSLRRAGWNIDSIVDNDSNTPLLAASKMQSRGRINNCRLEQVVATELIGLGCDVNASDKRGVTPLMLWLSKNDNIEDTVLSLLENGARTEARDQDGNTPSMHAAANKNQTTAKNGIELLSQFGDSQLNATNNNGDTALDIAVRKGHEELVNYLLNNTNN